MQQLPSTFCPAKWDEIMLNFSFDYVFSCCKATPVKFDNKNYNIVIKQQKENLLNGIQDPSCDYCWKHENKNLPSKRQEYLKLFDQSKFELYKKDDIKPIQVELYIGNECNFQCTYCNPKYSSQWELDVKKEPYNVFTDKDFFEVDKKNKEIKNDILDFIKNLNKKSFLIILGGEPLLNKFIWEILDNTSAENISIITNLSTNKTQDIDKLIEKCAQLKSMNVTVSIDSTKENAEFTRYGSNFSTFAKTFDYLLINAPSNMHININSVISTITIRDLKNFLLFVKNNKEKFPKLTWRMNPCVYPRIQSFETLSDDFRAESLNLLQEIKMLDYVKGADTVEASLLSTKFNKTLYYELKHFLLQFSNRKKITIPICLN